MPNGHDFKHLPLLLRYRGPAKLRGGGKTSPQTRANKAIRRAQHSQELNQSAQGVSAQWQQRREAREAEALPTIPPGVPLLLQVDPDLDLDELRKRFAFEIVGEQEEGYVIVASEDVALKPFTDMVNAFAVQIHGSATVASVHRLYDDPDQTERLRRLLSEGLFDRWPTLDNAQDYVVDVGIACVGTEEIPAQPNRGKRDTDATWARKSAEWAEARSAAYTAWDETKMDRETEVESFIHGYGGDILHNIDRAAYETAVLPDSFTIRVRISGRGLKDFVLNYPYIFEVVEPEEIVRPEREPRPGGEGEPDIAPQPPPVDAPAVCVIDSGIQEGHRFLQPAIDQPTSRCFLPGVAANDVGDFVRPGGHGTRVAGAILYGEVLIKQGAPQLPFWIQNARVLDGHNMMPEALFPPEAVRLAVEHFRHGPRHTRIFNHSINAKSACRLRYMSSWAAEIDALSAADDVLVIQSSGNLFTDSPAPLPGVKNHIEAGRPYPDFLHEPSSRVANPGQSLQALTVGSISYGNFAGDGWATFAQGHAQPSAFTRSGPAIWNVIKPEVVEFGGDFVQTANAPVDVQGGRIPEACPELVRSTMFPPGPAFDRDDVGTSYAAPKVTRIAASLQSILPEQPTLLYRALVAQSARWPDWAENMLAELRQPDLDPQRRELLMREVSRVIRVIGYGVPSEQRATVNTDFRATLITDGTTPIRAREGHIYQVPVPLALRAPGDEFEIRIEVTLSYVAQPRRTRRKLRRYLSTWVDWKSSRLGEGLDDFRTRALKEQDVEVDDPLPGSALPWTLHENSDWGFVRDVRRSSGTLQKDWAVVKSSSLPEHFCIAIVGHEGWSKDPDSSAHYTLAVTFEIVGQEVAIYEPLRTAVLELQAQVGSVEVEEELEVELDGE
ncbi:MAG: S8 family peptidase [Vicinamibacterales bacterium]